MHPGHSLGTPELSEVAKASIRAEISLVLDWSRTADGLRSGIIAVNVHNHGGGDRMTSEVSSTQSSP